MRQFSRAAQGCGRLGTARSARLDSIMAHLRGEMRQKLRVHSKWSLRNVNRFGLPGKDMGIPKLSRIVATTPLPPRAFPGEVLSNRIASPRHPNSSYTTPLLRTET